MEDNQNNSNNLKKNSFLHLSRKKIQVVMGIAALLILLPLAIYTNCGTIPENQINKSDNVITSSDQALTVVDSKTVEDDGVEKFDAVGNLIPTSGTFSECKQWVQEAYIKSSNSQSNDFFGNSVAISGSRIVVGASEEDSNQTFVTNGAVASSDNSAGDSGAAYIFVKTDNGWIQEAYLKASNSGTTDYFGNKVWISGNRIVVGAFGEDSNQSIVTNGSSASLNNSFLNSGAAYVFARVNGQWVQEAYLKAPNVDAEDGFGFSVSISGSRIVVGAENESSNQSTITNGSTASNVDDSNTALSGAAYVFARVNGQWVQEAYLKAPNVFVNDRFGHSVSISGSRIVVGANLEHAAQTYITNGTGASFNQGSDGWESGAAYVFYRNAGLWEQEAYIKASNSQPYDNFGFSVSISGNRIVVGSPYEDSNQTMITNGETASSNNAFSSSGAAYVFARVNGQWVQEAYLKAPNADSGDRFGSAVSIYNNHIVVMAENEASNQTTITGGSTASNDNSASAAGAAYVFARVNNLWKQEAYIKASNANAFDYFGRSVSIYGNRIVVGAPWEDSNQTSITNGEISSDDNSSSWSGAAYVYVCKSGTQTPIDPVPATSIKK